MTGKTRQDLERIFKSGRAAADPKQAVKTHLSMSDGVLTAGEWSRPLRDVRRIALVSVGKGGAAMAKAVEDILGDRLDAGVAVVKRGHGMPLKKTRIIEAGHPIPDAAGMAGSRAVFDLLKDLSEKDLVICTLSGGGSALLPAPAPPIDLEMKQRTTEVLLKSGATIHQINAVRKHLSAAKGGGLARAARPAAVLCLILSDVVGDDLDVIASGPFVPDASTFQDCMTLIRRLDAAKDLPAPVLKRLEDGAGGLIPETPKPGDPAFAAVHNLIVGGNRAMLAAAEKEAESLGYHALILTSRMEGEAREVARLIAAVGKEVCASGHPVKPPACLFFGGETTVTLKGDGKGGRNQELALAAALALEGWDRISLLSAGSDGTDGPTDAAGAMVDGSTCAAAVRMGLDPYAFLERNDAYTFFDNMGMLIKTGPTRTNVMDMVCVMAGAE